MELIGRVLGGRYRIVRGIGAGGMGGVYEAVEERTQARVAVKVIAEQLAAEPLYLERFRREALATAQLRHPNIISVTDFEHVPGEPPFLVMELLDGEPLQDRLRRGPLTPARAVDVTLQILAGLHAAHAEGVVHRDLKPGNVFLVPLDGDRLLVKVLDFGIAKLMDSETYGHLTQTGILVGTPRYAAPEQITNSKLADPRTDVFAVGNLLYCMLAGRPPHLSKGAQLLVDIADREPPDPRVRVANLNGGLVAVMRRAMHKAREHRFQSARDFADALMPFSGAAATDRGAPPTRPTTTQPAPTRASPAPPIATTPMPSQARPTPEPTWLPSPQPAPVVSKASLGVAAGVAVAVALVGALIAGTVGAVALSRGRQTTHGSASTQETPWIPRGGGTRTEVPQDCVEWERVACGCANRDVVAQYCALAQTRNEQISVGSAPTDDCASLLSAMRSACAANPPPGSVQPRFTTGIPECDDLTHFACTCGAAGAARDQRCRLANEFATEGYNRSPGERAVACAAERRRVEAECRP